jgi:transposase-like protein
MARQGVQRDAGKERFWRKMMALWRRSQPSTVRDFCAEHGLPESSFFGWRRTLAQRDQAQPKAAFQPTHRQSRRQANQQQTARFVPVRILPAPVGTKVDLQIVLNSGHIIRVPSGFDAATLRQLLAILQEEQPC